MLTCDAAIVGAGPAGSVAARLLASWGHRVVLLQRQATGAPALAESIPPSCQRLFEACGIAAPVEAAGFFRSEGNTVYWGSAEPRLETYALGARGYQVVRDRFDEVLRSCAREAGAEERSWLVREVVPQSSSVRVRSDSEALDAGFVLDCSGRAGVVARRGWRTDLEAHARTVALAGVWETESGWPGVNPTHTLVESYEDGWAWSIPVSPSCRYVTCMVDPQRTRLARGAAAAGVYRAELDKAPNLGGLRAHGRLVRGPWGSDASVYAAQTYAADRLLLAGDAASFVDPLSSCGVKKALASGWLAAVAVHTSLRTPAMTDRALRFFAAREAEMAAALMRQSRLFFADAGAAHQHLFWTDRAAEADPSTSGEPDINELRADARVQQAFAWLRSQPDLALRAGGTLRRRPHPVVRGHEIVLEDRLVGDACPGGLRFLRDVDLVGVVEMAPQHHQVPALYETYNRRFPPVALPDFLGALSVLLAFGLLEDSRASAG